MRHTEIELRGRLMALETIVLTLLAHIAAHCSDETQFAAQVMDNAESNLSGLRDNATDGNESAAADYACESFRRHSAFLLAHLHSRTRADHMRAPSERKNGIAAHVRG
jgi:hypothetical protein